MNTASYLNFFLVSTKESPWPVYASGAVIFLFVLPAIIFYILQKKKPNKINGKVIGLYLLFNFLIVLAVYLSSLQKLDINDNLLIFYRLYEPKLDHYISSSISLVSSVCTSVLFCCSSFMFFIPPLYFTFAFSKAHNELVNKNTVLISNMKVSIITDIVKWMYALPIIKERVFHPLRKHEILYLFIGFCFLYLNLAKGSLILLNNLLEVSYPNLSFQTLSNKPSIIEEVNSIKGFEQNIGADYFYNNTPWLLAPRIFLYHADLQNSVLFKANLYKANLSEANLQFTNLASANLQKASLRGADLRHAMLKGTILKSANLSEVDLRDSQLDGLTNLYDANLSNADLSGSDFDSLDLSKLQLKGANLENTRLQKAKISGADLTETNLYNMKFNQQDLSWTHFNSANLYKAQFEGNNLRHALFRDASYITSAVFKGNDLRIADFTNIRDLKFFVSLCQQKNNLSGIKLDPDILKALSYRVPTCYRQIALSPRNE